MSDATQAAMEAVRLALDTPLDDSEQVASAAEMALDAALGTIIQRYRHQVGENTVVVEALDTLADQVGHVLVPAAQYHAWSEEGPLVLDGDHIEEARSRAAIGQVDDCLHHLERALPADFAVIAERLAHHFRSRP